jgi:hypothetical protein
MTRRRKNTRKILKRGKAIRVPGGGSVIIQKDGAVLYRTPGGSIRPVPIEKNPRRRRKPTARKTKATPRRKPTAKKRTAKRTTKRARR